MIDSKHIIKYLAPLTILAIVIIFIVNVLTNGKMQHPGKTSYNNKCADCHGNKGEGIKTLVPPLLNSDFAIQHFDSIPCWIKNGMNHPITVNGILYDQPMYGLQMDDIEIANVMNYMSSEILNADKQTSAQKVKELLKNCN